MTKVKRTILSIAIAILYVLFIAYAIQTFYSAPKYENFCGVEKPAYIYQTQEDCEVNGGTWTAYPARSESIDDIKGYCELYEQCSEEYEQAEEKYNRNIFFITLILGLLTIIGAVILQLESVSAGFMAGGVLLVVYGTIRYWGDLSDIWRTVMLGLALALLVWIGYKKLK